MLKKYIFTGINRENKKQWRILCFLLKMSPESCVFQFSLAKRREINDQGTNFELEILKTH